MTTRASLILLFVAALALGPIAIVAVPRWVSHAPPTAATYELHLADDFQAWNEADAVASGKASKGWLVDAAGSQPWSEVADGLSVSARRPGPQGKIVGYSRLEPLPEEARRAACLSAAAQLEALLVWEARDHRERDGSRPDLHDLETLARAQVNGEIESLVVDQVLEEVTLPKSARTVYRAAVLVRAEPETLERLAASLRRDLGAGRAATLKWRRELVHTAAAAIGLALVIVFLYFFLNAGTKGHFAWPLRILSLGSLVLLYLGMFYLKGWFPP